MSFFKSNTLGISFEGDSPVMSYAQDNTMSTPIA